MGRSLSILAAVWLIIALLCTVFEMDLWELIFFFALPVRWCLVATGVIIALVALRSSLPDRNNRRSALTALVMAFSGVVLLLGFRDFLSLDIRFLLSRAKYERRLADVLSGNGEATDGDVAGVERGPPDRVAFYWKRGVTDNWVGLVYDPTGEVSKAGEFRRDWSNWHDPNLAKVRDLFGGAIFDSRHLTGPWYICWFT